MPESPLCTNSNKVCCKIQYCLRTILLGYNLRRYLIWVVPAMFIIPFKWARRHHKQKFMGSFSLLQQQETESSSCTPFLL